MTSTRSTPDDLEPPDARRRWLRRIAFGASLCLLAAALAVVWRHRETVTAALAALRSPSPVWVGVLLVCVLANVVLSATFLRLLLSRFGSVGVFEMQAVVAAATLMNFVPLRPGLFGRIAYHRLVNDIPARATARTVVEAAVISASIAIVLAAAAVTATATGVELWLLVGALAALLGAASIAGPVRIWARAALIRFAEVLVWALRYHAAFALIGSPIEPTAALAFACISVIATMVPFVSNGLGLREWAIGLLAPLVTAYQLELGVTAELVNRAAEILVIVVVGAPCVGWVARRLGVTSV